MKSTIIAVAALLMLAACDTPAQSSGCPDCDKLVAESKAAKKPAVHMQDCACCDKGTKH